jgi:adenosylcobinamide kinase / adenosylcobinamide-phosphate guanylyltransferase
MPPASKTAPSALAPTTLVLGGMRSGKSLYAEELIETCGKGLYLATAEARDEEMKQRIKRHKERRGKAWQTIEEPLDIVAVIQENTSRPILVDCLSLWVANLMEAGRDIEAETNALVRTLDSYKGHVVLVSNEVGLGGVSENALARAFCDQSGLLNQKVAAVADRVVFLAAGLPMVMKESL